MNLVQAWMTWFQGKSVEDVVLWGHSVGWWGRWGQVVALPSGMVIILDVIQHRLRAATSNAREALEADRSRIGPVYAWTWGALVLGAVIAVAIAYPYDRPDELPGDASTNPRVVLVIVAGGLLATGLWPVFRRVSLWLLRDDRLADVIRVLALVLLVVGFHFDLLAS
jgi:hypothetical protein